MGLKPLGVPKSQSPSVRLLVLSQSYRTLASGAQLAQDLSLRDKEDVLTFLMKFYGKRNKCGSVQISAAAALKWHGLCSGESSARLN